MDLLLKVLEEPPETTSFILICPNAFELRSTIRSRCMRIAFQPVDQALIQELLAREKKLTEPSQGSCRARGGGQRGPGSDVSIPPSMKRRRQPWLDFLEAMARRGALRRNGGLAAGV